jgi:UDP-N-acetylglucosamine--N-acetylmuramyl-(pentapeptide) pyrophosphoryl-undecaprenol N-acetylglucosamine transferase
MTGKLILLAAGGTGGHVFPAEALAETLVRRGRRLALVTDRGDRSYGGMLGRLETHALGLRRMGSTTLDRALGLASVAASVPRARRLVDRLMPAIVVGFGGYPSLPPVFAATRARIATLIHEQNAVLGRVNRLLAARTRRVATSFPEVGRVPSGVETTLVGNPVRSAIRLLRGTAYLPSTHEQPFDLLVIGGSQGARVFTDVVPVALARLTAPLRQRLRVVHQARAEDVARAVAAYQGAGIEATVDAFFADIGERLTRAHLVICRAGASTCAEIACLGRPALFVPYPFAADDHQSANARALAGSGAGWSLGQPGFTAAALAERLTQWMTDPSALIGAAGAAHALGRPDAAERLADLVDSMIAGNGGRLEKAA